MILKVPEIGFNRKQTLAKKEDNLREQSNKFKDNSHFLKLMQNHQMEEKIDMKLERIMTVFFKKEQNKKKSTKEEENSLE